MVDLAHGDGEAGTFEPVLTTVVVLLSAAALTLYLTMSIRLRHRGVSWSRGRDAAFGAGCGALAVSAGVSTPHLPFTGHMIQHVLLGMLAPLLIVLGRPVTLLLRTVRAGATRTQTLRVLHSRVIGLLVLPPVAAVVSVGGSWVLYRTPLFEASHDRPWLHALVHLHLVASGTLFTAAVCQLDPVRRRYSVLVRSATLVAAGAAHAVLAKSLYASPPPGAAPDPHDLQLGAQLMYYAGDVVEVSIAVVLALTWFAASGRSLTQERRRARADAMPS